MFLRYGQLKGPVLLASPFLLSSTSSPCAKQCVLARSQPASQCRLQRLLQLLLLWLVKGEQLFCCLCWRKGNTEVRWSNHHRHPCSSLLFRYLLWVHLISQLGNRNKSFYVWQSTRVDLAAGQIWVWGASHYRLAASSAFCMTAGAAEVQLRALRSAASAEPRWHLVAAGVPLPGASLLAFVSPLLPLTLGFGMKDASVSQARGCRAGMLFRSWYFQFQD